MAGNDSNKCPTTLINIWRKAIGKHNISRHSSFSSRNFWKILINFKMRRHRATHNKSYIEIHYFNSIKGNYYACDNWISVSPFDPFLFLANRKLAKNHSWWLNIRISSIEMSCNHADIIFPYYIYSVLFFSYHFYNIIQNMAICLTRDMVLMHFEHQQTAK